MAERKYISYNQIHQMCQEGAKRILDEFNPNVMIAIGGGGFVPARILRTFLKRPGAKNIPIVAIGLSLYEDIPQKEGPAEEAGVEVIRTQWLDFSTIGVQDLIGKRILIVDEVDDTRTTLSYAIRELEKDVHEQALKSGRTAEKDKTQFGIFVLHNKEKPKKGKLPDDLTKERYWSAETIPDLWCEYPWEARDIIEHTKKAEAQAEALVNGVKA